ncbi:SDR family NAD(P)-dependent oxidoreductase [Neobacillus cucumis]|uniref:SDR family NAD(P)-dependent oxidoreductase n=1 Tax=Neobacillus cucumis TaxID=1740721 RepID=UPI0019640A5A|nr:SDR family oxidoreductase [Neobacillus cucumis]MBM7655638.1 NAD(P)-dependent dehydrogenase (short-subunit alcohol dehydrogenase family) [Neobacillus cucumis]
MDFLNKVVVITGGARGIGLGVAKAYAEKGAKVVIADVEAKINTQTKDEFQQWGGDILYVQTDVRIEKDIIRLFEAAQKSYGRIDVLINNAGKGVFKSPYELTIEEWDDVLNTNLRSVFLCSREAARYMRKNSTGGAIVNLASTRALMSEPNSEAYGASKGGIVAITHALAASFSQDRITVNAISPGWIHNGNEAELSQADHEQHLSRRVGKPSDIARACLYLTDPYNDFVTGINLVVDGGMTRKMMYVEE